MQVLTGPRRPVRAVSLSGCGRWVGTHRGQFDADLLDRRTGKAVHRVADFAAYGCAVHPAGELFLVWGGDGFVVVPTADLRPHPVGPPLYTPAVVPLADGRRLVGVTTDGRGDGFTGWELVAGRPVRTWRVQRNGYANGPFVASPGGEWFAAQSGNPAARRVEVRATADGKLKVGGPVPGWLVGLRDDARPVVDAGGSLVVLDLPAGGTVAERKLPGGRAVVAAAALAGDRLLVCRAGALVLLDAETLAVRREYTVPTAGKPACVGFAPDGLTAAAGTSKGEVVVWDVD